MEQLTSPKTNEERDNISRNEHWNKNEVYILLILPLCVIVFLMYICFLRIFKPDIFQCHWELLLTLIFKFCMFIERDRPISQSASTSSFSVTERTMPKRKIGDSENQFSLNTSVSSNSSGGIDYSEWDTRLRDEAERI